MEELLAHIDAEAGTDIVSSVFKDFLSQEKEYKRKLKKGNRTAEQKGERKMKMDTQIDILHSFLRVLARYRQQKGSSFMIPILEFRIRTLIRVMEKIIFGHTDLNRGL